MRYLILVIVALIIAPLISYLHVTTQMYGQAEVCMKGRCFQAETALIPEAQSRGLMFRESLAPGSGMLFVFDEEDIIPFWMKNTLIPLDIIWIDRNRTVVFIKKDAQPCKSDPCPLIIPDRSAIYVLEINANITGEIGLETGDVVTINNL